VNLPRADLLQLAPELDVAAWLNTPQPISLQSLRGQVVLLHAFQMLCPACVSHGLPQASAAHERFGAHGLAVLGLHTVFEHHAAMGAEALAAFVHEYRLRFPIAIDRPAGDGPVPLTMRRYGFRGTPSLALIDHRGQLRMSHFGRVDDLALGAAIGRLLEERDRADADACTPEGCALPAGIDGARA